MLNIDPDQILTTYAQGNPGMSASAQSGLHSLLSAMGSDPELRDVRWAAYMLATVKHECANHWQPIEEYGKGTGKPYGVPSQVQDTDGTVYMNVYYGRGYVQLTWRLNYDKAGRALGLGNALVLHPEHALEPQTAYQIMSYGMRSGMFTGKKLLDYINDKQCDYINARRIINGIDRADLIAGYAQTFENLLKTAATSEVTAAAA